MSYRIEISGLVHCGDPRGHATLEKIKRFLSLDVQSVTTRDVYTVNANFTDDEINEIAGEICNPVIQSYRINESTAVADGMIRVGFLPGVTDNVARSARSMIKDILNKDLADGEDVYSSIEYLFKGNLSTADLECIALNLLANPLINSISFYGKEALHDGAIEANLPIVSSTEEATVKIYDLSVSDDELIAISEKGILALSLEEMQAVQHYFQQQDGDRESRGLERNPTDVELEVIAQTWSEHCSHKIFAANVDYVDHETNESESISSIYKTYIQKSTHEIGQEVNWLKSVFKDNAGVIGFNDDVDLVFKVETHNSPSALDPYGGAMTGIVGVNRDPLGTGIGANLLSNVWGYCVASPFTDQDDVPDGLLHPRIIRDGVHKGVIDGGNQSGIPYSTGWEYFDERFLGKPLVFAGTLGTLPVEVNGEKGYKKSIKPGDLVVMAGGRIGKDGIHGATFSSEELHTDSPVQAVQIGDPITQKKLYDFTIEARTEGLYRFLTDNGAGGLSSSIGEMAEECDGVYMNLIHAPLKYAGLQPWEILVSEAQERMSYAVPPEDIERFKELAEEREVEVTVLGEFRDNGKFHIDYGEQTVAYMDLEFMHDGCPKLNLKASWAKPVHQQPESRDSVDTDTILAVLSRLNICSGEEKARQYDHEVKGLSVIKPYVGAENDVQSDAAVIMIEPLSKEGVALSAGVLPRYSDIDTYHMTASVIDLAIRRIIAVGGKLGHMAGIDNFCWPDPVESKKTPDGQYKMAQLVRSNKAIYDYTKAYQVPCISGKDSMKNDSTRGGKKISIPPTLLFSTIAKIDDISKCVSMDPKRVNDLVYVLGETKAELGASEYYAMMGYTGNRVPEVNAEKAISLYNAVAQAVDEELCHSIHSPSLGGLAAAFAKMAIAGRLGLDIDLDKVPGDEDLTEEEILFSESNSRFVVTIAENARDRFENIMDGQEFAMVGKVSYDPVLILNSGMDSFELPVEQLKHSFKSVLENA